MIELIITGIVLIFLGVALARGVVYAMDQGAHDDVDIHVTFALMAVAVVAILAGVILACWGAAALVYPA